MLDTIMLSLSLPFSFVDAQTSDHLVMYTHASTHTQCTHMQVHTHMHTHTHASTHTQCTHTQVHTHMHAHMQAHIHSAHTCKRTPTPTCTCTHTHTHAQNMLVGLQENSTSRVMQQQITDFMVLLYCTLLMRPNQNSIEKTHTSVYTLSILIHKSACYLPIYM